MAKDDEKPLDPATEIQDILRDGKKKPLNFALLKAKEGVILKAHPLKSSEVMFREAKSAGGLPAFSVMGVMNVVGKVMEMSVQTDDVPRTLPKLAKRYFKDLGIKSKVAILLPSGERLEDGDDDDDDVDRKEVAPGIEAPVEENTSEQRAGIEARLAQVTTRVDAAIAQGAPGGDRLTELMEASRKAIGAGAFDEATGALDEAEAVLENLPEGFKADSLAALRAQLQQEFSAQASSLQDLIERGAAPAVKKAQQIAAMFQTEIDRDLKKAGSVLSLLKSFLPTELGRLPAVPDAAQTSSRVDGGMTAADGTTAADRMVCEAPPTPEEAFRQLADTFGAFWERLTAPTEADVAKTAEQSAIDAQAAKVRAMYAEGPLDMPRLTAIAAELARLGNLVQTAQQVSEIERTQPGAATAAREAMAGFDAELGAGTEVTPELMQAIDAEKVSAAALKTTAEQHMAAAEAMPPGKAKDAAKKAALDEIMAATVAGDTAARRFKAANGKKFLTEAITSGPLAPNAPRPFSDQSAAEFVAAFMREPELAKFATDAASTAQNPDAIASGMGMLCDNMQDGFADSAGNLPAPNFDKSAYARNLVQGAGAEGGNYMADAGAYIDRGAHIVSNPIPTPSGGSANGRQRDRSAYLAGAVVGPDGKIDPNSPGAQEALGHLRFNPDVVKAPTPELNKHVVKSFGMLSDPANNAKAQGILDGVDSPTGGGQMLVARGNGKSPGDVTADDAKKQVMASLLTPVHQGGVGSCFATAGVRRMSETDPLEAMQRYAELAETGTFRPRNGLDPIPAVTTFPADEDPLIRSMEYSAATVMAGIEGNSRNALMQNAMNEAVDGLIGPVGDDGSLFSRFGTDNWKVDSKLIRATLVSSFRVEYDANMSTAPSPDGSSSKGVYMLVQTKPVKQPIDTKAKFVAALTERVLTAIGEPADSDKGKDIAKTIAGDDYLKSLMQGASAPWNLGGGGMPDEADEVLFGGGKKTKVVTDARGGWDDLLGTTQGERTEELLADLLSQFKGSGGAAMLPIMNSGIHAFNGLPDHPSLKALKDGNIEDNIERLLTQPGKAMAKKPFSADEAQNIFRKVIESLKKWDSSVARQGMMDTALAAKLAGGLTPKATSDAIVKALGPYLDALALGQANIWRSNEVAAGKVADDAARDAKKAELLKVFTKVVSDKALTCLTRALPMPVFTVADTNWGNAEGSVNFVIAPDPLTGEARMWKQSMPSGELAPMGAEWVDTSWLKVAEDK